MPRNAAFLRRLGGCAARTFCAALARRLRGGGGQPSQGVTRIHGVAKSEIASADAKRSLEKLRSRRLGSSLPLKTFMGFVTAILAVVAISLFSYRSLEERSFTAQRVTQTVEALGHLEGLLSILKDAETGQRGYLLTSNESYLEPYNAALLALPRELERARASALNDAAQQQRLATARTLIEAKLKELRTTIDMKREGQGEAAILRVRQNVGRELMNQFRAVIGEMEAAERAELDERNREWQAASTFSTAVTWGGSALLFFLIIAAASMSSRDFHEQSIQAWLRSGQSELSLAVQGEQSVQKLGRTVIGFLCRYLDAQVGALYYAEQEPALSLVGSYGLASADEQAAAGSPAPKTGLGEQALRDNEVMHVSDVPDGYFEVSSGVGTKKPKELAIVPTTADARPNGVLELGFFRTLAPHELALLSQLSESIGTAFRSAKYRTALQNLLEETQRQAEELQTQQEELRVSNEELEQQTRTLQQSQERLTNQQAELEEINAQLEEQTQSLEKQREDLTRAQRELTRASAYKSEFLANMSHELRTPLNSSLILAKLLVDNRDGNLNPEQVKFAQTIYSAGNDLLTLINDILDLSRIEAGKLDVRPENVALARFAEELSNTFEPIAKEKGLEFSITSEPGLPAVVFTDSLRLSQILRNLLSNALKFTERGGVFLTMHRAPNGRVAFDVRDTGIGIAKEQHSVIFEAFRQADGTTNRKYGGTGLGLSISRDLARLLGGELGVDSEPGRGSTFTLVLPEHYVPTNGAGLPVAGLSPPARQPSRIEVSMPKATPVPPSVEPAPVPDDREGLGVGERSILIVEDDLSFARILYELAHELEFKALIATTGEQGLALAERHRPNAIVLDVGLPDRSGLSVLDALKHSPTTRHIPVHVLSASDYTQAALEMGALSYALKPVEREELVNAFRRLEAKFMQKLSRVLVVEDDAVHRESTCRLLAGDEVETVAVGTAAAALEQLAGGSFDCVVLDLSLPDRNGFELLQEMAEQGKPPPPVIVYTGRSLSREEEQRLRRFSSSIIIKGARSPERLLDEVTLFLHQVESDLPPDRQRMLKTARQRDAVFENRRVLIVEDDVRNIFALTSVLEPRGAKVEIARNGREALDHLSEKPGVDLVLMDIMMPEMDGLDATREIRKRRELQKLPIIALTAKAMADDRDNCLAAGANDYIAKPLDVDRLLSLARVWMPK
jgi:CheY-like chemotaxis protein